MSYYKLGCVYCASVVDLNIADEYFLSHGYKKHHDYKETAENLNDWKYVVIEVWSDMIISYFHRNNIVKCPCSSNCVKFFHINMESNKIALEKSDIFW